MLTKLTVQDPSQILPHKEVTRRFEDMLSHIALAGLVTENCTTNVAHLENDAGPAH